MSSPTPPPPSPSGSRGATNPPCWSLRWILANSSHRPARGIAPKAARRSPQAHTHAYSKQTLTHTGSPRRPPAWIRPQPRRGEGGRRAPGKSNVRAAGRGAAARCSAPSAGARACWRAHQLCGGDGDAGQQGRRVPLRRAGGKSCRCVLSATAHKAKTCGSAGGRSWPLRRQQRSGPWGHDGQT